MSERLFVSTASLKNNRDLPAVLKIYFDLGFRKIEISALHNYQSTQSLIALVKEYQAKGVEFIYHNYFPRPQQDIVLNVLSRSAENRQRSKDLIAEAVRLMRETGVDLYCFHPGYLGDPVVGANGMFDFGRARPWSAKEAVQDFQNDFMKFYEQLRIESREQTVFLGIENLFPPPQGDNYSIFCSYPDIEDMFRSPALKNSNMGILVDLGHLAISANILQFDRDAFLDYVIEDFGDRIYEVHLSENDQKEDLHAAITQDSWQLSALERFENTGTRLNGRKTRFCIESRGLTAEELKASYDIVKNKMESFDSLAHR